VSAPLAAAASPAARLLLLLVVVTSIATLPLASRSALVMAALAAAACVGLGRPSPRRLLFGVLSVVAMSSAVAAPALMHGQWLDAGRYVGRAAMAAVAALSLSASIGAAELGPALRTIGVPRGLASVIETMLRQVQAVQLEGSRILLARRLRGGGNVAPDVLSMLLVRTIDRAERVELAARLRGYHPGAGGGQGLARRDVPVLLVAVGIAVAIHLV